MENQYLTDELHYARINPESTPHPKRRFCMYWSKRVVIGLGAFLVSIGLDLGYRGGFFGAGMVLILFMFLETLERGAN